MFGSDTSIIAFVKGCLRDDILKVLADVCGLCHDGMNYFILPFL